MLIKVCGMSAPDQLREIEPNVDLIGFIYYHKSPRHVVSAPPTSGVKRVGVFVNAPLHHILYHIHTDQLDYVQLHGDETPDFCERIKPFAKVIKAFGVSEEFDFRKLMDYERFTDYFLFDTKTELRGGSGQQFNWSVLNRYSGTTPFLLSGGISADSVERVKEIDHPRFIGVDLNSRFENAPGDKNTNLINQFIHEINAKQEYTA